MKHSSLLSFLSFSFLLLRLSAVSPASLPLPLVSLLSLKSSLRDPHSTFHDWDPTPTFSNPTLQNPAGCSWSGVKCNPQTSQITSLNLSRRNLSSAIPAEIRYLTSFLHLNLSGNAFDGILQPAIFYLTELKTLDINHNNFNSTFPQGISKLKLLRKLLRVFNAYSNSFTGPL